MIGLGEKQVVFRASYAELEQLVKQVYPYIKDYEYICVEECGNDCSQQYNVTGKPDDWYEEKWNKGDVRSNLYALERLAADGHIEPGLYVISVSW